MNVPGKETTGAKGITQRLGHGRLLVKVAVDVVLIVVVVLLAVVAVVV